MKITSVVLCSLFLSTVGGATTPPPLPNPLPPMAKATIPQVPPLPPPSAPVSVWSEAHVLSLGLSDALSRDLIAHLPAALGITSVIDMKSRQSLGRRRLLRAAPETSIVGPTNPATIDTLQDIEPAIITNRFNGIDRTTTAFMQLDVSGRPQNYWTSTTDFVNFSGGASGQALPAVAGTTRSADPLLSENPYIGSGLFPKRTYCSGIAYALGPDGRSTYSTLDVWYTDDPGAMPWVLMTPIDQSSGTYLFDKPSIATSWNTGTLGWTYVAAVAVDQNSMNGLHYIQLYRQLDQYGFSIVNRQFSGSLLTSPIVVATSSSANIYLLWIDPVTSPGPPEHLQSINIARSYNYGNTFLAPVPLSPSAHLLGFNETINQQVRGTTVIMARDNPADNSIGVAWHQREPNGSPNTDIFFSSFSLATQTWRPIHHIGHPPLGDPNNEWMNDAHDQWNPVLDADSSGNYIVTWYDRRDDVSNNNTYRVYATKIHADGTAIDTTDTMVYNSAVAADPTTLPIIGGVRSMGEYQDVFEWFGNWYGSTTYIEYKSQLGAIAQDIYLPRIAP